MLRRFAPLLVVLCLIVGLAACSDDGDSSSGLSTPSGGDEGSGSGGAPGGGGDGGGGDGSGAFPDRDAFASALRSATLASDVEVDGETIRLRYDDGSKDTPSATINCSAASTLKADDDRIVLVYPDGSVDCDEVLAGR